MSSYIETLDELIRLKKNKGHKFNEKECDAYKKAWEALLVDENGFTAKVEKYFYDGFVILSAEPLIKYIVNCNNPYNAMEMVFSGKRYGKDSGVTFRILVSMLSQLLILNPVDKNLFCPIIKRIPAASKNKENKTIGNADMVLTKNLIKVLNDEINYPELSELEIQPGFLKQFVDLIDELMGKIDITNLPLKEKKVAININQWIHPLARTKTQELIDKEETQDGINYSENAELLLTGDEINEKEILEVSTEEIVDPYDKLIEILKEARDLSLQLHNENCKSVNDAAYKISELQEQNGALRNRIDSKKEHIEKLEAQVSVQEERIREISKRNIELQEIVNTLNRKITEDQKEIGQRVQMIEALSRDRSRQSDEQLNRLASKLKIEYRDFKDAESLEMNSDLGENMREQLKNVFAILIKAGISLD